MAGGLFGLIGCSVGEGSQPETLFSDFKAVIERHCNHCHGGAGSFFSDTVNFRQLVSQEDWTQHSAGLIVGGDRVASPIYNRLILATGVASEVDDIDRNMPFEFAGVPVSMTEEETEVVGRYVDSLPKGKNTQVPASPYSSLAKAKYLIHGGAPSDADISMVVIESTGGGEATLNRERLKTLVASWIETDEGKAIIRNFLRLTLEIGKFEYPDAGTPLLGKIRPQGEADNQNPFKDRWDQNIADSFLMTALDIVENDRPFTQIVTTRRRAVTSALLSTLSFADRAGTPVPPDQTMSNRDRTFNDFMKANMVDDDFQDWRFIEFVDSPNVIAYSNLVETRQASGQYALQIPRVGFFNTLAFQFRNPTNVGNDFRVSASQSLIVALNETFEAGDLTEPGDLSALDEQHADTGSVCYQCHKNLDPVRETFRGHYDTDFARSLGGDKVSSAFAFRGHTGPADTVDQLAQTIASHPLFAQSWTAKMCDYFNSATCDQSNPEFVRLTKLFQSSGFSLKTLIVELLSSPIVTEKGGGSETAGPSDFSSGLISASRRNHICRALNVRYRQVLERKGRPLEIPEDDVCQITLGAQSAIGVLSEDVTVRGVAGLVHSPESNAFTNLALEQFCEEVARRTVSTDRALPGELILRGFDCCEESDVSESVTNIVELIMGLPPKHPRHQAVKETLQRIYDHGIAEVSLNPRRILREVFTFACTSPDVSGLGL